MKMNRNRFGIGYYETDGPNFCEKMGMEKAWCDSCGKYMTKDDYVIVIPFLNSAYCKDCGHEQIWDCKTVQVYEEPYRIKKELEFSEIFSLEI